MVRTDEMDGVLCWQGSGENTKEEACNACVVLMGTVTGLPGSDGDKKKKGEKGDGGP